MQDKLCEILFRAYFTDGIYPDVDNLVAPLCCSLLWDASTDICSAGTRPR